MRRWLVAIGIVLLCVGRVGADLTITTTTTIEGAMAAMTGGADVSPKIVTRIKGTKSRTDIDMGAQSMATIIDFSTNEITLLNPAEKTAQRLDAKAVAGAVPTPSAMPKIDTVVKPTGKKRELNGEQCDEYSVQMRIDMAGMSSADAPPAAAAMLKDVRMTMTGFVWVAKDSPGSAEYRSFQKTASKFAMAALSGGRKGAMPAGLEQAIVGFSDAPGIPYLTELTMGVEGTGPMVEMMKKMGDMKVISRVTSVSLDPVPDAALKVPEDYKFVK